MTAPREAATNESVASALRVLARTRLAQRPDLANTLGDVDDPRSWHWLLREQWPRDAELQRLLPAPPASLVARTAGAHATASSWHASGVEDASHVYERLVAAGFAFDRGDVLDFGCGAGRVLRPFVAFAERCRLHGADVDAEAIDWARTHMPWACFAALAPQPASPYAARTFDAAFAFAVFSQLAEPLQRAWLADLARVIRPGGLLVLTMHGRTCAEHFAAGRVPLFPFPAPARIAADLPALRADGHLFYAYDAALNLCLPPAARTVALHGVAFVTPEHVRRHWLDDFELLLLAEAPRGFQDEIVLRRR
jgi:SAM-dependent methyltransferase